MATHGNFQELALPNETMCRIVLNAESDGCRKYVGAVSRCIMRYSAAMSRAPKCHRRRVNAQRRAYALSFRRALRLKATPSPFDKLVGTIVTAPDGLRYRLVKLTSR